MGYFFGAVALHCIADVLRFWQPQVTGAHYNASKQTTKLHATHLHEIHSDAQTLVMALRWARTADLIGLAQPVVDFGGMTAKFLGQLTGRGPGAYPFNHLLTKLRRIRRLGGWFWHFGFLLQEL
jgi:hypothetical protein